MFTLPFSLEAKRIFFGGPEADTARQILQSMDSKQELKDAHDEKNDTLHDERYDPKEDKQAIVDKLNRIEQVLQRTAGAPEKKLLTMLRQDVEGLTEELELSESFCTLVRVLDGQLNHLQNDRQRLDALAAEKGLLPEVYLDQMLIANPSFQYIRPGVELVAPYAKVPGQNPLGRQSNEFDSWKLNSANRSTIAELHQEFASKTPEDMYRQRFIDANQDNLANVFDLSQFLAREDLVVPVLNAEQAQRANEQYMNAKAARLGKQEGAQAQFAQESGTELPQYLKGKQQSLENALVKMGIEGKVVIGTQGLGVEMKKTIAGADQIFTVGIKSDFDPRNPEDLQRVAGTVSYSKEVLEKTVLSISSIVGADQQVVAARIAQAIEGGLLDGSTIRAGMRVVNIGKLTNEQIPNGLSRDDIAQVRIYEGMAEFETKDGDVIGITLSSAQVDAQGNNVEGGRAGMITFRGKKQVGEYGSVEMSVSKTKETLSGKMTWANKDGDVRITLGGGQEVGFNNDYSKRSGDLRGSLRVEFDKDALTYAVEPTVGKVGNAIDLGAKAGVTYHFNSNPKIAEPVEKSEASVSRLTLDQFDQTIKGETVKPDTTKPSAFLEKESLKAQKGLSVDKDQLRRLVGESVKQKDRPASNVAAPEVSDTIPDAFHFADKADRVPGSVVSWVGGDAITVSGINAATAISINGQGAPEYRIDGGAWTPAAGTVNNGSVIEVRHTADNGNLATRTSTLNIGGITDTFSSTTLPGGGGGL